MLGGVRWAVAVAFAVALLVPRQGRCAPEAADGPVESPEDEDVEADSGERADETEDEGADAGEQQDAGDTAAPAAGEGDADPLPPLPVERLAERGVELYRAGKHARALKYFLEAYRLDPIPDLLFNIAKVYEAQDEPGLAIEYYQQYLGTEGARAALRAKAQQRVPALRAAVKRKDAEAREAEQRDAAERVAEEERRRAATLARQRGRQGWRTAGFVALGGAAAALAAGATFGTLSRRSQDAFSDASWLEDKRSLRERAEQRALLADISFGAAALAGVAGAVLVLLGDSTEPPETDAGLGLRILPVVGDAGSIGLAAGGSF